MEVNGVSLLGNDGMDNDEYGEFVRMVSDVPATWYCIYYIGVAFSYYLLQCTLLVVVTKSEVCNSTTVRYDGVCIHTTHCNE